MNEPKVKQRTHELVNSKAKEAMKEALQWLREQAEEVRASKKKQQVA